MERQDILLDDNELLRIENGDFVVGPSNEQHIRHIIKTVPGSLKHSPLTGFNVGSKLGSPNLKLNEAELRDQLKRDGFTVINVLIDNTDNISVDAE